MSNLSKKDKISSYLILKLYFEMGTFEGRLGDDVIVLEGSGKNKTVLGSASRLLQKTRQVLCYETIMFGRVT